MMNTTNNKEDGKMTPRVHSMRTLNLRNIPDDLHKAVKLLSVEKSTTIEKLVILALQEYLAKNKEVGK